MSASPYFTAGIAAGRLWVAASSDRLVLERLQGWFKTHAELDVWDPVSVYASFLVNKIVVDNIGKDGDNELHVAIEEAMNESREFWRSHNGWPKGEDERWDYVEGFVRGAVGEPQTRVPN